MFVGIVNRCDATAGRSPVDCAANLGTLVSHGRDPGRTAVEGIARKCAEKGADVDEEIAGSGRLAN